MDTSIQMMSYPTATNMVDNHISILDHHSKESLEKDDTRVTTEGQVTTKSQVDSSKKSQKKPSDEVTINDMLAEVRNLWFELDQNEGKLSLDLNTVAWKLVSMKALPDLSTSQKYIMNVL